MLPATGFAAPLLLAIIGWVAVPDAGLAQIGNPLSTLQQSQGSLGNILNNNNAASTAAPVGQGQAFQPQAATAAILPQSRLEQIMSSRAGEQLQQFGYDQMGVGRVVSVPETGAVADDYVMGPGDEVVVSLRGQESAEIRATVDRNGQVVLPRLPPIPAS